jgi:hypothetical protein
LARAQSSSINLRRSGGGVAASANSVTIKRLTCVLRIRDAERIVLSSAMDLNQIARSLGGTINGRWINIRGPGHSAADRGAGRRRFIVIFSSSLRPDTNYPQSILTAHSLPTVA